MRVTCSLCDVGITPLTLSEVPSPGRFPVVTALAKHSGALSSVVYKEKSITAWSIYNIMDCALGCSVLAIGLRSLTPLSLIMKSCIIYNMHYSTMSLSLTQKCLKGQLSYFFRVEI